MYGHQGGKQGEGDELGDWDWHLYTLDAMYSFISADLSQKEAQKGVGVCICMTDLFFCVVETNTTL